MERDKTKSEEYFENFIAKDKNRINNFLDSIKTGSLAKDRIPAVSRKIFDLRLSIIIAKYSNGDDISKLLQDYEETLDCFSTTYSSVSDYVELIWILSIGIMIKKDKGFIEKICKMVKNDDPCDFLVDFLLKNSSLWDKQRNELKFPKPYKGLIDVINISKTNKQSSVERLKKYLEKEWYNGHRSSYWYNNHNSKHDTYFGYWSFESGALVKILNLDDTILNGVKHYPYDMVHWNK
jgi:hypothetical protein